MSVTKDGFYNIEGKMFEVVHGVEGDCLILGDEDGGTRISGPKPWGGGQVTKTFITQEKYGPIERLEEENAKLWELVRKYGEYLDQDHCEGCVCKYRCNNGDIDECWQLTEIRELASELGIRVGE